MTVPRFAPLGAAGPGPSFPPPPPLAPRLRWVLTERKSGAHLATLYDRFGSRVELGVNQPRRAHVDLSVYDKHSPKVKALETCIKGFYGDRLIYNGPVTEPMFDFDASVVSIDSYNSYFLERAFLSSLASFTAKDHSIVMGDLLNLARPNPTELAQGCLDHGIIIGSQPSGIQRTQSYDPGQQIWSAMVDLSSIYGAPDFSIDPYDDQLTGIYGQLNMHLPMQGFDVENEVRFQYGLGKNNCVGFKLNPGADIVRNDQWVFGTGEIVPSRHEFDRPSQVKYGKIMNWEASFASSDQAVVTDRSRELIAAYNRPPNTFTVQPAVEGLDEGYGIPPQVFVDYDLGYRVGVVAKKAGHVISVVGRVIEIKLEEATTAGDARVTLTCWPTTDVDLSP